MTLQETSAAPAIPTAPDAAPFARSCLNFGEPTWKVALKLIAAVLMLIPCVGVIGVLVQIIGR